MSDGGQVKSAADHMLVNFEGLFELSEYTEHLELVIGTLLDTLTMDGSVPALQLKLHIQELCTWFNVNPDILMSKTRAAIEREIKQNQLPSIEEW